MPKKINFKIAYASSEDDKMRASELESHGPAVRGWQSSKECSYPQELVLRLVSPSVLHQIQILAHQFLIPEKIELWLGPEGYIAVEDFASDPGEFTYVGYITLSDNESTSYKSRELKSITLPSAPPVAYLRLLLHPPHNNAHNVQRQVSLVAVQLLGEERYGQDTPLSPWDDLSFEMYVDRDVAAIIRALDSRKEAAVGDERFRYAGKLKSAMLSLRDVGEKLGRLEVSKWQAIQGEDYARANKKKEQMETLREETYETLHIHDLLEAQGKVLNNDEGEDTVNDSNTTLSEDIGPPAVVVDKTEVAPIRHHSSPLSPLHIAPGQSQQPRSKSGSMVATPVRTGSLRRKKQEEKNSYDAYDDRPIQRIETKENQSGVSHSIGTTNLKMNEREKKQAALAISVFGQAMVEKFYSRQFVDKEEGLKQLEGVLRAALDSRWNKVARAAMFLLHRSLRDKVFSVYSGAAALTTYFFSHFIVGRVSEAEVTRSVEKLVPELLTKSGDPTPRVHNTAVHTLLSLAHSSQLRKLNLIPLHLTRPLTSSTHWRLAQSRLEIVEQLILSLGISGDKHSGLTPRVLAEFGASGLHHPAEPVRKVAERVLVLVYEVNPRLVRKQLPPDDDITRRNLLYRHLMTEFDKIDAQRKIEGDDSNKMGRAGSAPCRMTNARTSPTTCATVMPTSPKQTPPQSPQEKQCIFCLERSDTFTEEGLNIHYWKYCPLLTRCMECQTVVEVSWLHHHLVRDCDMRRRYSSCDSCSEAVRSDATQRHVQSCQGVLRCPFCQTPTDNSDDFWRRHLSNKECPKHPRAGHLNQRVSTNETLDSMAASVYSYN